jgi:SAM-dependent methyltransferase
MANGITCEGVETSLPAIRMASEIDIVAGRRLPIHGDVSECETADLMLAMEVLEHIEDDTTALCHWLQKLRPGGHIIISVPAHQHRWGPSDAWAGHVRRYEKSDIASLCKQAGLELLKLENYGFPTANALDILTRSYYRKKLTKDEALGKSDTVASRTAHSGTDRHASRKAAPFLTSWPGRFFLRGALLTQALFNRHDLGPGYIVLAQKS